jgi:hypothetical protein
VYEELKDLKFKVHGKRRGARKTSRGVPLWNKEAKHIKDRIPPKVRDAFKSKVFSFANKITTIWQKVIRSGEHREEHKDHRHSRNAFFARWHAREDSLLIHRRDTRVRDEMIACLLIFSYALLLVILSMPMPLIKRTARVAAIVKRKLKLEIAQIRRTVSMTSMSSNPHIALKRCGSFRSFEALKDAIR